MEVFCAGLGRTGTYSITKALRLLGYHSALHFDIPFLDLLDAARDTGRLDLSRYDTIDAVSDMPTAVFIQPFLERYPAVRVILTVREEKDWVASVKRHYDALPISNPRDYKGDWPSAEATWRIRLLAFGVPGFNRFMAISRYRQHNDHVRRVTPPGQLLEIDLTRGNPWPKLCTFLDRPTPSQPFPHLNRSRSGKAGG